MRKNIALLALSFSILIISLFISLPNNKTGQSVASACTDSDSGANLFLKGHIIGKLSTGASVNTYDWCSQPNQLAEWSCTNNIASMRIYSCQNGCFDGACRNTSKCIDSDNGKNYFVKGTSTGFRTVSDYCESANTLIEYYCGGILPETLTGEIYLCPGGCTDGACMVQKTTYSKCARGDSKSCTDDLGNAGKQVCVLGEFGPCMPDINIREEHGEQKTAIILVDYVNDGNEMPPDKYYQAILGPEEYSINEFIKESSYGKAWLSGDVYGWYHVTVGLNECYPKESDLYALANVDVDYTKYDNFLFIIRDKTKYCTAAGSSSFGKMNITTPDGKVFARRLRTRDYNLYFDPYQVPGVSNSVIAHEFGHAFGMRTHTSSYDCGKKVFSANASECRAISPFEPFDMIAYGTYWSSHFSTCFKDQLGWLDNLVTVSSSGLYAIYPFEENSDKPKAIKILLKNQIPLRTASGKLLYSNSYYLEYRKPIGFDKRLELLEKGAEMSKVNVTGIQVRLSRIEGGDCTLSVLLDMTPGSFMDTGSPTLDDSIDSFLLMGKEFYDPINNIKIKPEGLTSDGGISVSITYN